MNFTPGLWHHDEWGHICAGSKIIGIAYERELDEIDHEELPHLDNAKMMAAAPEMLAIIHGLTSMSLNDIGRSITKANALIERLRQKDE